MASGAVKAGKAFVELGVKDKTAAAFRKASQRLKAFGVSAAKVGSILSGLTVAGAAASVRVFQQFGDVLDKMSARTKDGRLRSHVGQKREAPAGKRRASALTVSTLEPPAIHPAPASAGSRVPELRS